MRAKEGRVTFPYPLIHLSLICLSALTPSIHGARADQADKVVNTEQKKGQQAPVPSSAELDFVESEQLLDHHALWRQDGFRVDLSYYSETINGFGEAPSGSTQGVHIGLGARLDEDWSISGTLRYGVGAEELSGLNFSGTLSTLYHLSDFALGFGLGVIGVEELEGARADKRPQLINEIVASYTLSESSEPISRCVGFGPLGAFNAIYRLPISKIFGLKVGVQLSLARLGCERDTDRVEPDTAKGIVIRQYWSRWAWSVFGGLSWR